jgi:DNA-binding MarR family transcriptional regulator
VTETNSPPHAGRDRLGQLIGAFMTELHRYDRGRTLPLLHRAGLTTPQLATLEALRESRTPSAVARDLGLSRPATSQMIDKLVRRKLVHRTEGRIDRRQRSVVVSARGRDLIQRIHDARAARFEASLAALPSAMRARLAATLGAVVGALRAPAAERATP